jgi:hypothetical protein
LIDEEIKKAYSKVTKQYETKSDRVSYKDAKNSFRAIREKNFIYYELNTSVLEEIMLWISELKGGTSDVEKI